MNTPMLSQLEEARAPWNWPRTTPPHEIECPYCQGRGYFYGAENIRTGEQTSVKEQTFHMLPTEMQEAINAGKVWVQWRDECPECCGTGTIEEEVLPDEALMELALGI